MRGSAVVIPLQPRTAARQPTTPPGRYERAPGHSSSRTCSSRLLTATTSANATARTGCPAAARAEAEHDVGDRRPARVEPPVRERRRRRELEREPQREVGTASARPQPWTGR